MWAYTHKFAKSLAGLPYISMYASVQDSKEVAKAKNAGFKLLAWLTHVRGKPGGNRNVPTRLDIPELDGRTLICPEQRLGWKRVTCDRCRWCVEGKGNVAFLFH